MHIVSLLIGARWYFNTFYILFTYFVLFVAYNVGYEDDICEIISNLQVQGAKFGRKKEFMEFVFSKSDLWSLLVA